MQSLIKLNVSGSTCICSRPVVTTGVFVLTERTLFQATHIERGTHLIYQTVRLRLQATRFSQDQSKVEPGCSFRGHHLNLIDDSSVDTRAMLRFMIAHARTSTLIMMTALEAFRSALVVEID